MEPHKNIEAGDLKSYEPPTDKGAQVYFAAALAFARDHYQEEMDRISSTRFEDVTPNHFFQEYVWVVHATGFSAKAVGAFMPRLMLAYGHWENLGLESADEVVERVRKVCNNPQKIKAVRSMASKMNLGVLNGGWEKFRDTRLSKVEQLSDLPYIGKITMFHLGRNIGLLECVKPDLHLIRMAKHWGYDDCESMCKAVRPVGMPLGIVDLVFWYAASTFGTIDLRSDGDR